MSTSRKKVQVNQRDSSAKIGQEKMQQPVMHDIFDGPIGKGIDTMYDIVMEHKNAKKQSDNQISNTTHASHSRRKKVPQDAPLQTEPQRTERVKPAELPQKSDIHKIEPKLDTKHDLSAPKDEPLKTAAAEPIVSLSYNFIYFIRLLDNTKSDESTYKIGYSNDVPAYRKQLEMNMPQNVKTMRVLHCKKGDADKLSTDLCNSIKSRELRSSWFRIKKEELDNITNALISNHQCEVVSESKAVVKPAKKARKPSN